VDRAKSSNNNLEKMSFRLLDGIVGQLQYVSFREFTHIDDIFWPEGEDGLCLESVEELKSLMDSAVDNLQRTCDLNTKKEGCLIQ
jgi:hypothetical protein